jgi:hypothetical protein
MHDILMRSIYFYLTRLCYVYLTFMVGYLLVR